MKHSHQESIQQYITILDKYRKTLNLVSGDGFQKLEDQIADALEYVDLIKETGPEKKYILDVGSGAGLPGIIIAICLPQFRVVLSEIRQKRASFLRIATSQLELKNATVFADDVKKFKGGPVTHVSAQAVADLRTIYCLTHACHDELVVLLSRKSREWQKEIDHLKEKIGLNPGFQISKKLTTHGTLVALELAGGKSCQP